MIRTILFLCLVVLGDAYPQRNPLDQYRRSASAGAPPLATGLKIGRVKYAGGGDWYNDPHEEVNLLQFIHQQVGIEVDPTYQFVDLLSDKLFSYPFLFLTGHGNIALTSAEVERLRAYLNNGGFLYIDDDYGLDKFIRREMKKVFPETDFVELPFSHPIYHTAFEFPQGPPKTMEHNGKPPQGFGIIQQGRVCVFYTYECNPSDGWNEQEVHDVPEEKRQEALRFGTNIVVYALTR